MSLSVVAPIAFVPVDVAQAAGAPSPELTKEMAERTLYGDTTDVTLTMKNTGDEGYNTSFRDVLPKNTSLVSADPAPTTTLKVSGKTVLIWENVADAIPGASVSISYTFEHDTGSYGIGSVLKNSASVYVSANARAVPDFDPDTGEATGDYDGSASVTETTQLVPFILTKSEPNAEAELLRGVHDHQTVYTLEVQNNYVVNTTGLRIDDWLPSGLEFLECGTVDNTTVDHDATTAGVADEYPGSGAINASGAVSPGNCRTPSAVDTQQTDPDGAGGVDPDVYTKVSWDNAALGGVTLSPGQLFTLTYVAAIPLRRNVEFTSSPGTSGEQSANLDNNTGTLTKDEELLVNYALATGTARNASYTDDDTFEIVAEDISVHKTTSGTLEQGTSRTWTLLVESSEYTTASGPVTIVDTVPDGLSVTSGDYSSASENGDGSWKVTWNLRSVSAPSGSRSLSYVTTTDTTYTTRGGGGPVASMDSVTNSVVLTAPSATVITTNDGTASSLSLPDASSGSLAAGGIEIDKAVAGPTSVTGPGSCGTSSWITEIADDYTVGDTVCWRIGLDFPPNTDTLDVVIKDFLPAGYLFVGQAQPAITGWAGEATFTNVATEGPKWTYPAVDAGGLRFEAIIESKLVDATAVADADITANLVKASFRNTDGAVFQLRDQAEAEIATPVLTLNKRIADIVGDTTTDFPVGRADVKAGDAVTYEVVVRNTGNRTALNSTVWDRLPSALGCDSIVTASISDGGTCVTDGGRDWIRWTGLSAIPPGGVLNLTYVGNIPLDVTPNQEYKNKAGVVSYEADTNDGDEPFVYVPANNIDPDAPPSNAPRADDTATVTAPDTTFTKTRVTGIDDGAAGNELDEATIGESVTYTITAMIPEGTTVDGPVVITDVMPDHLTIVGTPTIAVSGAAPNPALTAVVSDQTVTVTVAAGGTAYVNPSDGSGDDEFELTIETVVADVAANVRAQTRTNAATFTYTVKGDTLTKTAEQLTTIVEPSLGIVKVEDAAADVVAADEILNYTLTVTNGDADDDSSAYDVVVVDTVPAQIIPQDAAGDVADGAAVPLPGGASWNSTSRTISWSFTELRPGQVETLQYAARITGPVVAGGDITNIARVTGTSMPGDVDGERGPLSPNAGPGSGYVASDDYTVTPPSMTIGKASDVESASIGDPITSTITVTVPAQVEVYDVVVLDTLPSNVVYTSTVTSACVEAGGACDPDITVTPLSADGDVGTVGWSLGDLDTVAAADRVVSITYRTYVTAVAAAGDVLTNSASLYGNIVDRITPTPGSLPSPDEFGIDEGPAVVSVDVVEPALTITKEVTPLDAEPGDTLTYTIVVQNASGPSVGTAFDVVITDAVDDANLAAVTTATTGLPAGVTLVSAGGANPPYEWNVDEIAPGGSVTLTYTATLDPSPSLLGSDVIDNVASIDEYGSYDIDSPPPGAGPIKTYGPHTAEVTVPLRFPALSYDKAVGAQGSAATVNTPFEWVITVTNTGDGVAYGLDVTDTLPEGWSFDGVTTVTLNGVTIAAPPAPTVTLGAPTVVVWTDLVATMAPGDTVVVTFSSTPQLAAQTANGTGDGNPHTNQVVASAADGSGATGNGDGPYSTNEQDPGETTPATADAFLPLSGTIGDEVWIDLDGDVVRDAGWETDGGGIADVTVTLTGSNGVVMTTETDADGMYLFTDVPPGDYTVTVDSSDPQFPGNVTSTGDGDGDNDTPHVSSLTLPAGGENLLQDFGYVGGAAIGDTVFYDVSGDGTQDGLEPGIPGLVITLLDDDGNIVATDVTDDDGMYLFPGLPDGDWTVVVSTPPTDSSPTGDADGIDTPHESTVTLSGADDLDQDFGYRGDLAVGDTVFLDLDADQAQTGLEPGIEGVTLTLNDATGTAIATTVTDDDGTYLFSNLLPGSYTVEVDDTTLGGALVQTVDADGLATPDASTTTLATATGDDLDQDFGYRGTGSIGDRVWLDLSDDGVQDPGEAGIEGLLVTLRDADGVLVATTTTGPDGAYVFENLPPGEWTVTVTPDVGYLPTFDVDGVATPNTATVSLGDGQDRDDVDFGYRGTGTIGDTVWIDLDEDGTQNGTEPGLPGAVISLELDGVVVATDTTDPDGTYLFENLPPGEYQVLVDDGSLPLGFDPTNDPDDDGIDHESNVTLPIGGEDLDQDFGYFGPSGLGDRVWLDRNADGVQDADEPGIGGVTVELYNGAGALIDTRVTDDNGRYLFDGLFDDSYTVVVLDSTLPDVTQTYDADGIGAGSEHRSTTALDAVTNPVDLLQDFGYVGDLAIGDTVFLDLDEDGVQGALEPGISGATVSLIDVATGLVTGVAITDVDGTYLFDALDARSWRVEVDLSALAGVPTQTVDADGLDTPDASTTTLVDADDLDQDFGYVFDGVIGDRVFFDTDADAVDDGQADDPGIAGVIVELLDGEGRLIARTTTDADGIYGFTGLPGDDYTIVLDPRTLPDGLRPTYDADGIDTPARSVTTLPPSGSDLDQDFGFTGTSSIGDQVWFDDDVDGVRSFSEAMVADVTVRLYLASDLTTPYAETVTLADGTYLFENLRPGEYVVEFVAPDGSVITPARDAGDDDAFDSDAGPDGRTDVIVLGAEEQLLTVDAGIVRLASVGDLVWQDVDRDGLQGTDDPGLPGVTVTLYEADGVTVVDTTTTDDDGAYLFDGLLPGDYVIGVDVDDTHTITDQDVGDDDAIDSDVATDTGLTAVVTLSAGELDDTVDAGLRPILVLGVTKSLDDGPLVEDEEASYTITITNVGAHDVPSLITVHDVVPEGLEWTGAFSTGWACSADGRDVRCLRTDGLAVGDSVTLQLTFLVVAAADEIVVNTVIVGGGDEDVTADSDEDLVLPKVEVLPEVIERPEPNPAPEPTTPAIPATGIDSAMLLLAALMLLGLGIPMIRSRTRPTVPVTAGATGSGVTAMHSTAGASVSAADGTGAAGLGVRRWLRRVLLLCLGVLRC